MSLTLRSRDALDDDDVAFAAALNGETGTNGWTRSTFEDWRKDHKVVFVVAPERGFAVGRVAADEVELASIVTASGHRRAGVGRLLLERFLTDAAALGATVAYLEVRRDNGPALAMYRGAGFEETGVRPGYYADGTDALVFSRSTQATDDPAC